MLVFTVGSAVQAERIDDFSTDSSGNYTKYVILDNGEDHDTSASDSTFSVSSGTATVVTTVADDVEQQLYALSGASLGIGQELQVDLVSRVTAERTMGLFVGATNSLDNVTSTEWKVRKNFVFIAVGQDNITSGTYDDGTNTGTQFNFAALSDGDTLFIAYTASGTFEVGLYDNDNTVGHGEGSREVYRTYTDLFGIDGSALGFYTDIRAAGTLSRFDNLTIYGATNVPTVDAGVNMITWSGEPVQLAPTVVNNQPTVDLTYSWSADSVDGVVFSATNVEAPTVTINKTTENPSVLTLTLSVNNVDRAPDQARQDTVTIDVYDDHCMATKSVNPEMLDSSDLNEDCITDLQDIIVMAQTWLDDYTATGPIVK